MKYYLIYSEFVDGKPINGTGHVTRTYDNVDDAILRAQSHLLECRDAFPDSEVYVSDFKNYFRRRYKNSEHVIQIIEGD